MITFFIWLSALFCPNPTHTAASHGDNDYVYYSTSNAEGDTGGETGGNPPPPPPPPPPAH